jgi:PEP-CTERM motif
MGKKILLIAALAIVLPVAAFADSDMSFTSDGGLLWASSTGLTVTSATLVNIDGVTGTNLGTIAFSTGLMNAPGSVLSGATFRPGGPGSVSITGSDGGALFLGAFSQNSTWTVATSGTSKLYTFVGVATGTLADGTSAVVQISFTVDGKIFQSNPSLQPGSLNGVPITATVIAVPEPGSLAFLGAGLIGLVAAIRKKQRLERQLT